MRTLPGLTARVLQTHTDLKSIRVLQPGLTDTYAHTCVHPGLTAPIRVLQTHTGSYSPNPGLTDTYTYICEQYPGLTVRVLQTHTKKTYAGSYSPNPGLTDTYRVLQLQSGSCRHIHIHMLSNIRVLQSGSYKHTKKHTPVLTAPIRFLQTHTGSYRLDLGLTDTYAYACEQNPGLIALVLQTHTRYVIKIRVLQPGSYRHRNMYAGSYSPNPGLADTHTPGLTAPIRLLQTHAHTKSIRV